MKHLLVLSVLSLFLLFNIGLAVNPSCIDINAASKEELERIRHIGRSRAEQIIELRKEKLFSSIDDLSRVRGIGPARVSDIKEENLACVQLQSKPELQPVSLKQEPQEQLESSSQKPEPAKAKIILSCPENNPVNKEIETALFVSNLKKADYDVKISIEKEGKTFSNIYNKNEDKWQSSHYYIGSLFSGNSFEGTFKLKIKEENLNFQGKADIIVRIREGGKSNYLEHKEEVNITEPDRQGKDNNQDERLMKEKSLASLSQQFSGLSSFPRPFSIALGLALFSGILILTLKRKMVKP